MTFGFYERLSLHLTLALGVLLIAFTREVPAAFWLPVLGAVGFSAWQQARGAKPLLPTATLPTVLAVAFAVFDWLFLAPNYLIAIVDLILLLLGLKLLGTRRVADNLQMLGLSFLLVLGASVITVDAVFGVILLGYIFAGLSAMVLQNLRGHWENTGGETAHLANRRGVLGGAFGVAIAALGTGILMFTLVLYFAFPRVGLRWWRGGAGYQSSVSGFSNSVDLNAVGRIKLNPAIALRVEFPSGLPEESSPLRRLRGVVLNRFDGMGWTAGGGQIGGVVQQDGNDTWRLRRDVRPAVTMRITPDSGYAGVLFLPRGAARIDGDFRRVWLSAQGYFQAERRSQGRLTYEVMAEPTTAAETLAPPTAEDLSLPATLSPRVSALAATWTAGATGHEAAARLVGGLRSGYRYTNDLAPESGSPLEDFLFSSKAGHCELYATALAVMLRAQGIPARVINGFAAGEEWEDDAIVYREMHAHSWVAAYFAGEGWRELDATPASVVAAFSLQERFERAYYDSLAAARFFWGRWFVDYDFSAQARMAEDLRDASDRIGGRLNVRDMRQVLRRYGASLGTGGAILFALAVALAAWRRRRRHLLSESRLTRLYRARLKAVEKHRKRQPGETPLRFAEQVVSEAAHWGPFLDYTRIYYKLRYGNGVPADGARFLELHDRLGRRPSRVLTTASPK